MTLTERWLQKVTADVLQAKLECSARNVFVLWYSHITIKFKSRIFIMIFSIKDNICTWINMNRSFFVCIIRIIIFMNSHPPYQYTLFFILQLQYPYLTTMISLICYKTQSLPMLSLNNYQEHLKKWNALMTVITFLIFKVTTHAYSVKYQ